MGLSSDDTTNLWVGRLVSLLRFEGLNAKDPKQEGEKTKKRKWRSPLLPPWHLNCPRQKMAIEVCPLYGIGCRAVSRILISNLGYKALLVGIALQDQGSKLKSCRKSCRKSATHKNPAWHRRRQLQHAEVEPATSMFRPFGAYCILTNNRSVTLVAWAKC